MKAKPACKYLLSLAASFAIWAVQPLFAANQTPVQPNDILLKAMQAELNRSFSKLKTAADAPLYFIAYRIYDVESCEFTGEFGALKSEQSSNHKRTLEVEIRVGNPHLDNTHSSRSGSFSLSLDRLFSTRTPIPIDDDEAAIRTVLWERTDSAFKSAQSAYAKLQAEQDVKLADEDKSDDFSLEKPVTHIGPKLSLDVNENAWKDRVRHLSNIYRAYPEIKDSSVEFSAKKTRRYLVTSEGSTIEDEKLEYRVYTTAEAAADDGMKVWLYDGVEASSKDEIPNDQKLEQMVKKLAEDLRQLRVAKAAEPYAGPAILMAKSAGVFFHEIFGHRIEGHRQKDETEGQTFTKMVGQQVMPSFITVTDNPLTQKIGDKTLNGYYLYDDEGVPAQNVKLVDAGILKNFLMSRSPIKGFDKSNGHGRSAPGKAPVARQGNLTVSSSKTVPFPELRSMLIAEVKKQNKPYGLIFDELAGGFTLTHSSQPQVFALKPLRVWRVYPDGRPDELLRGVDLVGTPLASLESIISAASDLDTFNGTCGAESGYVPVSASSPSLLVKTIEVERNQKDRDKAPILPAPDSLEGQSADKHADKGAKSE